jgi:hypothetical protein
VPNRNAHPQFQQPKSRIDKYPSRWIAASSTLWGTEGCTSGKLCGCAVVSRSPGFLCSAGEFGLVTTTRSRTSDVADCGRLHYLRIATHRRLLGALARPTALMHMHGTAII